MATIPSHELLLRSASSTQQQQVKRRAACDECRTKKLKCTGEQPACARCVREHITCTYSPQKQMGRPKKRQRTEDEGSNSDNNHTSAQDQTRRQSDLNGIGHDDLHMDAFNSTFLPSENDFTSWPQTDWPFGLIPDASSIPALTPDSSSNSPPTLNLPPELQHTHAHSHQHTPNSTRLLLDPSLTSTGTNLGLPPTLLPACACLSTLYLTLNHLQNMDPHFPFPFALHPLREAMSTAAEVLACAECPTRFISAVHNTQLVGTLLVSIAERFGKVLAAISTEAARAGTAHETKKFRLADLNTSTLHLHTGGIGCAAAFSLSLAPSEWRSLAKKVVRAEVYGPAEGNDCCAYFMGIAQQMEDRQNYFHTKPLPEDFPTNKLTGVKLGGMNVPKEEHLCLKLVGYARTFVEGFDWE